MFSSTTEGRGPLQTLACLGYAWPAAPSGWGSGYLVSTQEGKETETMRVSLDVYLFKTVVSWFVTAVSLVSFTVRAKIIYCHHVHRKGQHFLLNVPNPRHLKRLFKQSRTQLLKFHQQWGILYTTLTHLINSFLPTTCGIVTSSPLSVKSVQGS